MSNVPPPKSIHGNRLVLVFLSSPYASAAAVGSFTIRFTVEARDLSGILRRLPLRCR